MSIYIILCDLPLIVGKQIYILKHMGISKDSMI